MPEGWGVLFNSYYEAAGLAIPGPSGSAEPASIAEVLHWRERVDQELQSWLLEGMIMSKPSCWSWACTRAATPRTAVDGFARWL